MATINQKANAALEKLNLEVQPKGEKEERKLIQLWLDQLETFRGYILKNGIHIKSHKS